jgi:D-glycero-alpha-D-manno-heptose-7-phosphate kinase
MKKNRFIITQTPLRISFAGGGSDFKNYFINNSGQVVSSSIDKYVYVTVKNHDFNINPEKYRLNYYDSEHVDHKKDIKNNIIREVLNFLNFDDPIYISTVADIPAYSGLGSSSAFAVGLIKAIHELKGNKISNYQLAEEACHVEIDILKNPIGMQDQFACAVGDINHIIFNQNSLIEVKNLELSVDKKDQIFKNLMFFSTKISRSASKILAEQNKKNTQEINIAYLNKIKKYSDLVLNIFHGDFSAKKFGKILDESWQLKKKLAKNITNSSIDKMYQQAINAGSYGGKVSGAGGGGFLMLVVPPENQKNVRDTLFHLPEIKISYENLGSKVIFNQ